MRKYLQRTMELIAGVRGITIEDRTGTTLHKQLLAVCGAEEMFTLRFLQYSRSEAEKKEMSPSDLDMSVKCRFAQMRFTFLNIWAMRLLVSGELSLFILNIWLSLLYEIVGIPFTAHLRLLQ